MKKNTLSRLMVVGIISLMPLSGICSLYRPSYIQMMPLVHDSIPNEIGRSGDARISYLINNRKWFDLNRELSNISPVSVTPGLYLMAKSVVSHYVHGSQEKIGALFDEARKNAPTILNFDEFEALVPNRSKINNSSESGEVNEFLSQMNNCGKDRIFVIASSNRPDLIDPAILRKGRMDKVIFIPVPDKEARQGIFKIHMKDRPASDDIDYVRLAEMTENFVASDIAYIVNDAATRAFEDDVDITQSLLEEVIKENNPSVSSSDLQSYEQMRKKMESSGVEPQRRRIGFVQN